MEKNILKLLVGSNNKILKQRSIIMIKFRIKLTNICNCPVIIKNKTFIVCSCRDFSGNNSNNHLFARTISEYPNNKIHRSGSSAIYK